MVLVDDFLKNISRNDLIQELEKRIGVKSTLPKDEQVVIFGVRELNIILSKLEEKGEVKNEKMEL